jgi:5-methylcytosine-specific restriction endonuclease McrA
MNTTTFCEHCKKQFTTVNHFKRHLLSNSHKLRTSSEKNNLVFCSCSKSFTTRSALYRHRKDCSVYINTKNATQSDPNEQTLQLPQTLRKENEEIREVITEMREEISELKSKVNKLEGKSTNNFTIVQQGRRKVNKNIRNELIIKQDNKCNHCNNVLSQYYQVDHITALQYGGTDEFDNLQALCCECHAKKSSIENVVRDKIRNAIVDIIKTESVSSTNF